VIDDNFMDAIFSLHTNLSNVDNIDGRRVVRSGGSLIEIVTMSSGSAINVNDFLALVIMTCR
jgi:hypothetical protein